MYRIFQGDCMELLKEIPDSSIDMILCDLPYGKTRNAWDVVLPLDQLWAQYRRIITPHGVIALHSQMPFTVQLCNACPDKRMYRYELVWVKEQGSDFLNANRKPLNAHEAIQIFYKQQPAFHKQMTDGKPYKAKSGHGGSSNYGTFACHTHFACPDGKRCPTTVLRYAREKGLHPTQKPVPMLEWLIKSYSDKGSVVLDNCMGSGSTGVACIRTGRDFIGMEREAKYFEIAKARLEQAAHTMESKS